MEAIDIKTLSDSTIVKCANCNYTDIKDRWKDGKCPECKSKAVILYTEPFQPYAPNTYPVPAPSPYAPWYDDGTGTITTTLEDGTVMTTTHSGEPSYIHLDGGISGSCDVFNTSDGTPNNITNKIYPFTLTNESSAHAYGGSLDG